MEIMKIQNLRLLCMEFESLPPVFPAHGYISLTLGGNPVSAKLSFFTSFGAMTMAPFSQRMLHDDHLH